MAQVNSGNGIMMQQINNGEILIIQVHIAIGITDRRAARVGDEDFVIVRVIFHSIGAFIVGKWDGSGFQGMLINSIDNIIIGIGGKNQTQVWRSHHTSNLWDIHTPDKYIARGINYSDIPINLTVFIRIKCTVNEIVAIWRRSCVRYEEQVCLWIKGLKIKGIKRDGDAWCERRCLSRKVSGIWNKLCWQGCW